MSVEHEIFLCDGTGFRLRRPDETALRTILADVDDALAPPPEDIGQLAEWTRAALARFLPATAPIPEIPDADTVRTLSQKFADPALIVTRVLRRLIVGWRGAGPRYVVDRHGLPALSALCAFNPATLAAVWVHARQLIGLGGSLTTFNPIAPPSGGAKDDSSCQTTRHR